MTARCLLGIILVVPLIYGHANNKNPDVCTPKMARRGLALCDEAFERAFNINRAEVLSNPKRQGCCISQNIEDCYIYSYTAAKCLPTEYRVPGLVEARQRELQKIINKEANYLGNAICNYISVKTCGHLADEYRKTLNVISDMNGGSSALLNSGLTFLASILTVFLKRAQGPS